MGFGGKGTRAKWPVSHSLQVAYGNWWEAVENPLNHFGSQRVGRDIVSIKSPINIPQWSKRCLRGASVTFGLNRLCSFYVFTRWKLESREFLIRHLQS